MDSPGDALTPEQLAALVTALSAGVDRETAARYIGLDPEQLASMIAATAELRLAVERAEATREVSNTATVTRAAGKDWRAASYLLERRTASPSARCGAVTRSGGSCGNARGFKTNHPGAGHCHLHGGRSPSGRKSAAREQAAAALESLAIPVTGDPVIVLQSAVDAAYGVLLAAQRLLEENGDEPVLELYERAIDRASRVAKAAADVDLDSKRVEIAQGVAMVVVLAVGAALDKLGVSGDQRALAESAAAEILEAHAPSRTELN